MKKPANSLHLILIALLCASTIFFTACKEDEEPVVAPTIVSYSENQAITIGETLTLNVTASGSNLTYQWYKDATAIDGATSAEYKRENANPTDAGSYTCKVSNSAGEATTPAIVVTVGDANGAPDITSFTGDPQTLTVGGTLTLSVVATGNDLKYEWTKDGATIDGATTSEYTKQNITKEDAGSYVCKVSNTIGEVTTSPMVVTVNDEVDIFPEISDDVADVLKSASFELVLTDFQDTLVGNYKDNADPEKGGLYGKFTVKNIAKFPRKYYVIVKKIAMPNNHFAAVCIGQCINVSGKDLPATRKFEADDLTLAAGKTTDPSLNSYVKLFSGNTGGLYDVDGTPGQTMLRVKYVNASDETDFIQFKIYWRFDDK